MSNIWNYLPTTKKRFHQSLNLVCRSLQWAFEPEETSEQTQLTTARHSKSPTSFALAIESSQALLGVPQGSMLEENMHAFEFRDWRSHFTEKLKGKGLEIGPLHRPTIMHDNMDIDYIDRYSLKELREHYPELRETDLIEPDILGDAQTLNGVPSEIYDFLIAAHVIEHMKNPLGALEAWCRVLKPGGKIHLVVPDKRAIFDRKRVRTTLEHIIWDYYSSSDERDAEHYLDFAIYANNKSGIQALKEAQRLQETDYSIHFHVFLPSDIVRMLEWFGEHIHPLAILEGPSMSPGSDEFHLLLEVGTSSPSQ